MLDAKQRVRYARHRSLIELGDEGVDALLRSSIGPALDDARAEATRADYLGRAGLSPTSPTDPSPRVPVDVRAFAGVDYLDEAAAACLGALHAVARIRVAAGLDRSETIPEFQLREDTTARSDRARASTP